LDRRLSRGDPAPILLGFSGGGDSLALLRLASDWCARAGRQLIAVTVDHQIRPEGAAWARWCEGRCSSLGVTHLTRVWQGPKPATGLPAAAREARHRLLAEAARQAGARVILLGHTADDVLESSWMRSQGFRTPAPQEWAPSPIWPEGRDHFLLRPLLRARRGALRQWLRGVGESWIDDPGNDDPGSGRARARRALERGATANLPVQAPLAGLPPFQEGKAGDLIGQISDLNGADDAAARFWLGAAAVCVGGAARAPSRQALEGLLARLNAGAPFTATLAGARLIAEDRTLSLVRETGDRRGGRGADTPLWPGATMIWDGRFEIVAHTAGWSVGHLSGRASHLDPIAARALHELPSPARRAVPALLGPAGEVVCPSLRPSGAGEARSLVMGRLAARCGGIQHESELATWRNARLPPKSLFMSGKRPADEPS
jgi:tRNA(Ile)-lysidine synthase